eukprot:1798446-Pyramimonas_sp.AAC.1
MEAHRDRFRSTLLADGTPAAFASFERGAKWIRDEFPGQNAAGPPRVLRYEEGGYYAHAGAVAAAGRARRSGGPLREGAAAGHCAAPRR